MTSLPAPDPSPRPPAEYRIARLQQRLADGPYAQLGMRVDFRGDTVLITSVAPSPACRDYLRTAIAAELDGLTVHVDITLADAAPPDHCESVP